MNELLEGYIEDLKYNLINLNECLMEMEKGNISDDVVNTAFRVAHTIKGNSAALEFNNIEKVTHTMEDILHDVRSGKILLTDTITNVLFSFHDFLEDCLIFIKEDNSDRNINITEILQQLDKVSMKDQKISKNDTSLQTKNYHKKLSELEDFEISPELWDVVVDNFKRGYTPYSINVVIDENCMMKSLRTWHIFNVASGYGSIVSSIPDCVNEENLEKEEFNIVDNIIRFIIVTDKDIEQLVNDLLATSEVKEVKKEEVAINPIEQVVEMKQKTEVTNIPNANQTGNLQGAKQSVAREKQDGNYIRIPVMKVDTLMDMLGELLILNSQFEQQLSEAFSKNSAMLNNLSRASKLIKEIQASSMSIRMIEIKPTLHRLHRIARETSAELNKKVSVHIEGEETEIDRSAAEKIFDPLMHLVRNAISHGIEEEGERIEAGKKPEGTVRINAYSKRGNVYIEVSDDGKGIDTKKILKKAIALNMADENKEYDEDEIIKFIFRPGFSTQEVINSIAGRGVGMNVVEEAITHIGGGIDVVTSPGKGSTFIIKIPMNIAVMNGTIIEVAGGRYIIPTLFIKEFFIVDKSNWVSMKNKMHALRIRDNIIPVISASKLLGILEEDTESFRREVVILEMDQKLLAFPVDKIIGRQEIVSKPLDSEFSSISYSSGAAILGDGKVSLILDVEEMFKI